jgi:hypothetical protein
MNLILAQPSYGNGFAKEQMGLKSAIGKLADLERANVSSDPGYERWEQT